MEPNQVRTRAGDERDQLLDQLVGREDHVRSSISPNLLEVQRQPSASTSAKNCSQWACSVR
jgi:hypothetical protein